MSPKSVLRWSLSVVGIAAVGSLAGSLVSFTDDFSAATLNARWGELTNATVSTTVGHNAPGSMRLDGRTTQAKASVSLSGGKMFPVGQTYVTFWMSDSTGMSTVDVHIDEALSGPNGACGGFWIYIAQLNVVNGVFSSLPDWEEEMPGADSVINEWGAVGTTYGGTFRSHVLTWLSTDTCAVRMALDTTRPNVNLRWRINVSTGVVFVDDWTQSAYPPTAVREPQRVSVGKAAFQDIAQSRVYLPNGQLAGNRTNGRNLPTGCYLVRNNTGVQKLVVRQ